MIELKSVKTRISAPAHPSATDGRVSGLVFYENGGGVNSFEIFTLWDEHRINHPDKSYEVIQMNL